ncbi:hypothetical protein [Sphingorhabdus buctiana]|uniref:hypothetical protein n=1 Tax=Sphingorhabdus buctiana TaxID=1508805 RepID=UPI0036D24E80
MYRKFYRAQFSKETAALLATGAKLNVAIRASAFGRPPSQWCGVSLVKTLKTPAYGMILICDGGYVIIISGSQAAKAKWRERQSPTLAIFL